MKRKPRILFLLLAAAMMLSMVMPVAAAAPNISVSAGFADDVTLRGDKGSYEASLSVDLHGLSGFTGYELVVDWESLAGYTGRVGYSANDEVRDANGSPKNYNAHDQLGPLEPYQRYLQIYGADTIANLTGVAIVKFTLDGSIPAGKYPVKVTVIDVIDENAQPILMREDPSTYLMATGVLTVRNADGTVPDEPAENIVYQISSAVDSDAGTGSVSFSKTEAKAGETITVTLDAATGHELDNITATDTTGGSTVNLTKVSDTEYTFTMPAGNVQVSVSYKLSESTADSYAIRIGAAVNGTVHTNGVKSAEAGETVTVFVKPNENYETVSVAVAAETGVKVTVSGGTDQVNGFCKYTFAMPESAVTVDAVFRSTSDSNKDEVSAGHILTKGTVLTSNNRPLPGAKVQLKYTDGAYKGSVAAETVTGADGTFVLDEVSGSYNYTLQAIHDTGIQQGKPADPGYTVYSQSLNISHSAGNVSGKGEVISQTLTVALYYEWDVDSDGSAERIFSGSDDRFLTTDDFYQTTVGGQTVNVYADSKGKIQSEGAYYLWEIDGDGVKEKVYVGGGFKAGTDNDHYLFDVDYDPKTADIEVYVGMDCTPATPDDTYTLDVNNDGKSEIVYAGTDGLIATEDDWYTSGGETIYAGKDKIAGTSDDWYMGDGDGHDEDEKIFAGRDRLPHTEDDFYQRDVDEDGELEAILAGTDKTFNTADDYYDTKVGGQVVKVYPGTGDNKADPYEFGRNDDHYDWTVGGEPVTVRVGTDKTAGTADDEYDWTVKDSGGSDVHVTVIVGPDGVPGTEDDCYKYDADKDGEDETIYVGPDGKPGTKDDWYYPDITFNAGAGTVNGSGTYTVISSAIKSLPTASRSGYNFNGWTTRNGSGSTLSLSEVKALRADTTLYASYSSISSGGRPSGGGSGSGTTVVTPNNPQRSVKVTFDTAGGSSIEPQTVESGKKVVKPSDPVRHGFEFTGWYTDEARTKAFDFNTKVKADMTLYAGWKLSGDNAVFKYLTRDHIAYINGFDDGLVHAGASMTRGQAAQVFFNLLNSETKTHYRTGSNNFSDVDSGSWYNEAVSTLANMGILKGYGNGKFGPDDTMTRTQFATICVRIAGLEESGNSKFADVAENHWAYGPICAAADAGLVNGYGDGRFGPDDQITRAQVVALLNRVMNRSANAASLNGQKCLHMWLDNMDSSVWYYYDMIEAGNGHSCTYDAAGTESWTGLKAAK